MRIRIQNKPREFSRIAYRINGKPLCENCVSAWDKERTPAFPKSRFVCSKCESEKVYGKIRK